MGFSVYAVMEEGFNGDITDPHYGSHFITTSAIFGNVTDANEYVMELAIQEWEEKFYDYTSWNFENERECGIISMKDKAGNFFKIWCELTTFMC